MWRQLTFHDTYDTPNWKSSTTSFRDLRWEIQFYAKKRYAKELEEEISSSKWPLDSEDVSEHDNCVGEARKNRGKIEEEAEEKK